MTDIGFLAQVAYDLGDDPIDYATVNIIQAHVDAILLGQGCLSDFSDGAHARQILGDLMDAGWTPPEVTK